MIPLHDMPIGKKAKIKKIKTGKKLEGRMASLGLLEGDVVKIVHHASGPIIIAKGDLRFALGHGMSMKIMVEEI
ncbi:MAG: ferrous iron transport protein A [Candidatus Aureabacteria bacterium]|nr:ferrous iron transport protein A [Candidatus Auribacterota bacterium]